LGFITANLQEIGYLIGGILVQEKILVIDDEEHICQMIKDAFSDDNFDIHTAGDFASAKIQLDQNNYNVILTDKNYPGEENNVEGGMDILRYAKQHSPAAEILIMTAFASIDSAIEAVRLGAFDYILKPFKIDDLKSKIGRILEYQASINPDNTIPVYKNLKDEIVDIIEKNTDFNREEKDKILESITNKLSFLFSSLNERERVIIFQREMLGNIAGRFVEFFRGDQYKPDE
jgi:DNA-binding response OmpR family regulator